MTGERSNTVIHTVLLKKYNYIGEIVSSRKYIPHSQSPLNVSVCMYIPYSQSPLNVSVRIYIPHSGYKENVSARWRNTNNIEGNVMCDCSLIQHGLFLETVCVS